MFGSAQQATVPVVLPQPTTQFQFPPQAVQAFQPGPVGFGSGLGLGLPLSSLQPSLQPTVQPQPLQPYQLPYLQPPMQPQSQQLPQSMFYVGQKKSKPKGGAAQVPTYQALVPPGFQPSLQTPAWAAVMQQAPPQYWASSPYNAVPAQLLPAQLPLQPQTQLQPQPQPQPQQPQFGQLQPQMPASAGQNAVAQPTKKVRRSPSQHAAQTDIGTTMRGNDGNMWEVKEDVNGRHYWARVKQ